MLFYKIADRIASKRVYVFGIFWLFTFLVYLPAINAGFVSDTTGWYQSLTQHSFSDYINRSHFGVKSMYQVTQFNTWLIYQIFGLSHWAWHVLFVSMHAVVCSMLYYFFKRLFSASGLEKPHYPALAGALIFCISPYNSEVIVWEASFHYLQALILIFGILLLVQRFQDKPSNGFAFWAALIFFVSTFTHELFYLSPILTLAVIVYYRIALGRDKKLLRKSIFAFTVPQIAVFVIHLIMYRVVYGGGISHVGTKLFDNPAGYFLVKAPWYFFHLFAMGRFFGEPTKMFIYDLFRNPIGAIIFYSLLAAICLLIIVRLRKMITYWKLVSFTFFLMLIAMSILVPMWFPEGLFVVGDRYMYLMLGFQWMMIALLLFRIRNKWLVQGLWLVLFGINVYINLKLSKKWYESEKVIAAIQTSPNIKPGKVKLLLNSPACIKGIPMIGTSPEGEFRLMHNLFFKPIIADTMLEVASYNMISPKDGAHVEVVNDSMIKVTLNQWGTWWWLGGFGAFNYENNWFRLDLKDPGHWYYVILKKPASTYDILYQTGEELKLVDMTKEGVEQY